MAATTVASTSRISFQRLLQKTSGSRRNHYSGCSLLSIAYHSRNVSCSSAPRVIATASAAALLSSSMAATSSRHQLQPQRRNLSGGGFTFAGPRELQDVLKTELLNGKKATEIADLWYTYHETKVSERELASYTIDRCCGIGMTMMCVSLVFVLASLSLFLFFSTLLYHRFYQSIQKNSAPCMYYYRTMWSDSF
jgi:hypothetical protein